MSESKSHAVEQVWVRAKSREPVSPHEEITLVTGEGVDGDHTYGSKRHVTLIFADDWDAALRELGHEVPPAGRRANVLLSGGGGLGLIGSTVRLGGARVEILGETKPCFVMDKAAEGLQAALEPEGRGGVWGRVLEGGVVRIGDALSVEG